MGRQSGVDGPFLKIQGGEFAGGQGSHFSLERMRNDREYAKRQRVRTKERCERLDLRPIMLRLIGS